jgi:hypothetical protein
MSRPPGRVCEYLQFSANQPKERRLMAQYDAASLKYPIRSTPLAEAARRVDHVD